MKQIHKTKTLFVVFLGIMTVLTSAQASLPIEVSRLYGGSEMMTGQIRLKVPNIAEEGSMINVGIQEVTPLPGGQYIKEVAFYSDIRKQEPIARFRLGENTVVDGLKLKVRLRDSSRLYAVARLNSGKLLMAEKFVKVTIGGCGGPGGKVGE